MEKPPLPEEPEITILEYLKSQFSQGKKLASPDQEIEHTAPALQNLPEGVVGETFVENAIAKPFPWLTIFGLCAALLGQVLIEPSENRWGFMSVLLYGVSIILLVSAGRREEWSLPIRTHTQEGWHLFSGKTWLILPGIGLALLSFFLFSSGSFGLLSTFMWMAGIGLVIYSLWVTRLGGGHERKSFLSRIQTAWQEDRIWIISVILVLLIILAFRFVQISKLPPELISAQIEHIYTVEEILQGNTPLIFTRNLVIEPLQYYWSAALLSLFGNEVTFTGLKVAYGLAGLVGIYYLYQMGRLLFNRWVGLIAALLFGVAFWPNLQIRSVLGAGMILPLLIPACFYLLRGLLQQRSNDLVIASLLAGGGLLTHKVFLIFPLVGLVVLLIWLFSNYSKEKRQVFWGLLAMSLLVTAVTITPLLRAITLNPSVYLSPILSRVSDQEVALGGNPILLFLGNWASALGMVNWSNRNSWVDGIPLRPAVDWVTAAFFVLGLVMAILQYRKKKDWTLLALLVLYPLFLIPSAMSLAFPNENPSLSRALGSAMPVFLLAAVSIFVILSSVISRWAEWKPIFKVGVILLVALPVLVQNYQLTFVSYPRTYRQNAWNASEMADAVNQFETGFGRTDSMWVVGYPYWVDARAVAIEAGYPYLNMALPPDQIDATIDQPNPKIFLLNIQDGDTLARLQADYPTGVSSTYQSSYPEKNFIIFAVSR
ncbi:MAG: glycosyltransferase family 39 protein [Anaerolineaceae bacterium]